MQAGSNRVSGDVSFDRRSGQSQASGMAMKLNFAAERPRASAAALPPPPKDIILSCEDKEGDTVIFTRVIRITWDMSWSDVLDELKFQFGRAVVFSYGTDYKNLVRTEGDFDEFCHWAEGEQNKLFGASEVVTVKIVNATFHPSTEDKWKEMGYSKPSVPPTDSANGAQAIESALTSAIDSSKGGGAQENEEFVGFVPPKTGPTRWQRLIRVLDHAPYQPEYMWIFGCGGFLSSCTAVIVAYIYGYNTVASVAFALPWNIFLMSLFVSEVEEGYGAVFRMGIGYFAVAGSAIAIPCYSIAGEFTASIPLYGWFLAGVWYVELMVCALGWDSWFRGVSNVVGWLMGGCPVVGVRETEPVEAINIIGNPPALTMATRMLSEKERHPGVASWVAQDQKWALMKPEDRRVRHVAQCFRDLSAKGNPRGPLATGIIARKTARQLRKWLVRTEANAKRLYVKKESEESILKSEMSEKANWGVGIVQSYSKALGLMKVEWERGGGARKDERHEKYHETGENGAYELLLCPEPEVPIQESKYRDDKLIHDRGRSVAGVAQQAATFARLFVPPFVAWLMRWIAFFTYFGGLYLLEYSVTSYTVLTGIGSQAYTMKGKLYNAEDGTGVYLHIYCKGFTTPGARPDGRNPIIIEAPETLGHSLAVAELQDQIAQYGVACAYDRFGFGFSTDSEASPLWNNRTPARIAQELHYALVNGLSKDANKVPVSWLRTIINENNQTQSVAEPVLPPFILVGIGAGGLYARQFAAAYPEHTAGLVLVDAQPAIDWSFRSPLQKVADPWTLTICQRFLQPMGLIHLFATTLPSTIFAGSTVSQVLATDGTLPAIEYFLYKRQWCPAVAAELDGLFAGGAASVAAADRTGYDTSVVVWVRESSSALGVTSSQPIYNYNPNGVRTSPPTRRRQRGLLATGDIATTTASASSSVSASSTSGGGGSCPPPAGVNNTACKSWFNVQAIFLDMFSNPWVDPDTNQISIARGDPTQCTLLGCDEWTSSTNPSQISNAAQDLWYMLGYGGGPCCGVISTTWVLQLGGPLNVSAAEALAEDLANMLSYVKGSDVVLNTEPYSQLAAEGFASVVPDFNTQTSRRRKFGELRGDDTYASQGKGGEGDKHVKNGRRIGGPEWYTGPNAGTLYQPRRNDGSHFISFVFYGHKALSTSRAEAILRGTENKERDTTAPQRRQKFLSAWRVLGLWERVCTTSAAGSTNSTNSSTSSSTTSTTTCLYNEIAVLAGTYASYLCPQNTYVDATSRGCSPCDISETSPVGSTQASDCFACPAYTVLNCRGTGCDRCPPGMISNTGALDITECVPLAQYTVLIKGPIGTGASADMIAPYRQGLPEHKPFSPQAFILAVAQVLTWPGHSFNVTILKPATDLPLYPESRCYQLRGGCSFSVSFWIIPETLSDALVLEAYLEGRECLSPPASDACPQPDVNDFAILSLYKTDYEGSFTGSCATSRGFQLNGSTTITYQCPTKFYQGEENECLPCPDMSTSDAGVVGVQACTFFETFTLTMKDASVTYKARTEAVTVGSRQTYIFGATPTAQPNAVDIIVGNPILQVEELAQRYIKIRGYALHPYAPDDPFAAPGTSPLQITNCFEGSNCFNATAFREDISSLTGAAITPNEVYLVYPSNCPNGSDGDWCGPWPGLPGNAASSSCVIAQDTTYWTAGSMLIGTVLGGPTNANPISPAITVGDCASQCATYGDGCGAFLYSPSTQSCALRSNVPPNSGVIISSTTDTCCDSTIISSTDTVSGWIQGMQMYWKMDPTNLYRCQVISDNPSTCAVPQRGPDGEAGAYLGSRTPADIFHVKFRLHGENHTGLEAAYDLLARNSPSDSLLNVFATRNVIQVYWTGSASQDAANSAQGDGNLRDMGYIQVCQGRPNQPKPLCVLGAMECTATCADGSVATCPAATATGGGTVLGTCSLVGGDSAITRRGAIWQASCPDLSTPVCTSGAALCQCDSAWDRNSSTSWPCSRAVATGPAQRNASYLTVRFVTNSTLAAAYVEVSQVQFAGVQVGSQNAFGPMLLEFSDGTTQEIFVSSTSPQSFYIRPVITYFITFRLGGLDPDGSMLFRVIRMEVFGRTLESSNNGTVVDLFRPKKPLPPAAIAAYNSSKYTCPATTFASAFDAYNETGGFCAPCPYPTASVSGAGVGTCFCPACGDGYLHWQADEECDDGNKVGGDGCSALCKIEVDFRCSGPKNTFNYGIPSASYMIADICARQGAIWIQYGPAAWNPRFGFAVSLNGADLWIYGGIGANYRSFFNDVSVETSGGAACVAAEPTDTCLLPSASAAPSALCPLTQVDTSLCWNGAVASTPTKAFPPRGFHGGVQVELAGSVFVVGGHTLNGWTASAGSSFVSSSCPTGGACNLDLSYNDVWVSGGKPSETGSVYGIDWTLLTAAAPWTARGRHATIIFQNMLWILGGETLSVQATKVIQSSYLNDVWSSADGMSWTVATVTASWSPRCGHTVVMDGANQLYLAGGHSYTSDDLYYNDVWRSPDGKMWTLLTSNAAWSPRWLHAGAFYGGSLYVTGGHFCPTPKVSSGGCGPLRNGTFYNEVWTSTDGAAWYAATLSAAWSPRAGHALLVAGTGVATGSGSLWLMGGYSGNAQTTMDDVWIAFKL